MSEHVALGAGKTGATCYNNGLSLHLNAVPLAYLGLELGVAAKESSGT